MSSQSDTTTDDKNHRGVLLIDFDQDDDMPGLVERSDLVAAFDGRGLAFWTQGKTAGGKSSRYDRLVTRDAN